MGKVVVVGSSNTDMVLKVDRMPKPGETVLGGTFFMAAGGKGANQAVAAARAGGDVTFIACVGNDLFGEEAIRGFRADRINTDFVFKMADSPSGVALIFVDGKGENSIGVGSGANAELAVSHIENARQVIEASDVLVMQLETPVETVRAAARVASAAGKQVILNPAPAQPLDDDLLQNVTIITPNETETEILTGVRVTDQSSMEKAARRFFDKGIDTVIITLGSNGAYVATPDGHEHVPAFKVTPVDTTAAGDVFNGCLAVALSNGEKLVEAVRFASAGAAFSVTKNGAQPSAPHRKDILAIMQGAGRTA